MNTTLLYKKASAHPSFNEFKMTWKSAIGKKLDPDVIVSVAAMQERLVEEAEAKGHDVYFQPLEFEVAEVPGEGSFEALRSQAWSVDKTFGAELPDPKARGTFVSSKADPGPVPYLQMDQTK